MWAREHYASDPIGGDRVQSVHAGLLYKSWWFAVGVGVRRLMTQVQLIEGLEIVWRWYYLPLCGADVVSAMFVEGFVLIHQMNTSG